MSFESELPERSAAIEEQVRQLQAIADPVARATAEDLVQSVMELHRAALERMTGILQTSAPEMLERCAHDTLVGSVLLLHDLHPETIEQRVARAVEQLAPSLARQRAELEIVRADEEEVRIRVHARDEHHVAIPDTFYLKIEQLLAEAAPDVSEIAVERSTQASADFVSIDALGPAAKSASEAG